MRTATLLAAPTLVFLATMAAPARAQDERAAELFYKAFWLEQASGKPDEAFELYRRVAERHSDSPEAPRALLAMARISLARGADISAYAKLLEKDYAHAKREIELVRRLLDAKDKAFDPSKRPGDSAVMRKIKQCFFDLQDRQLSQPDRMFLVETGAVSHPMLGTLLRGTRYNPVLYAAQILVAQKSAAAYSVLEKALLDEDVLFKNAIVHALRGMQVDSPGLAKALVRIYDRHSPALQEDIAGAMARLTRVEGETRKIAYALLTRALSSKEGKVREAASKVGEPPDRWPDEYVAARLARMEKRDWVFQSSDYSDLVFLAGRVKLRGRVLSALSGHEFSPNHRFSHRESVPDEGALLLGQAAFSWAKRASTDDAITAACKWSPKGATWVLERIVETGDTDKVRPAAEGMRRAWRPGQIWSGVYADPRHEHFSGVYRKYLGNDADRVVRLALDASFDQRQEKRDAGSQVSTLIGLGPNGDQLLIDAVRKHPEQPLPQLAYSTKTLKSFGPERMARVALHARTQRDFNLLLTAGTAYAQDPKATVFYRVVVPKVGPDAIPALNRIVTSSEESRALVAEKLLVSAGKEWKWNTKRAPQWDSFKMSAVCIQPGLVDLTLKRTSDPRVNVAQTALMVAAQVKEKEGLDALVRGLKAPTENLRKQAIRSLGERGDAGIDALIASFDWNTPRWSTRDKALETVGYYGSQKRHADFLASKLAVRKDEWSAAWSPLHQIAPQRAVDLALVEAVGKGEAMYREEAVEVLTKTRDKRRIPVFSQLLKNEQEGDILQVVVETVAEQYLIELGPAVLEQLRSPVEQVREAAKQAIQELKFYADAKKTFSEQK